MRKVLVPAFALAVLVVPRPAAAWGSEAHKYIASRIVALLPPAIRPYFEKHRDVFVERSVDPDLWRIAGFEQESPYHFVDMDAYGAHPFKDLPHAYDAAVGKFGKDVLDKNGTLPWRAEEIYRKLVEAFTQKGAYSHDNIKLIAAWLTHYASDAHVPFHASSNHDGQLTGQWGLHSRFESEAFERNRNRLRVRPGPITTVTNPRELIFDSLAASFTYVQPILDADRQAVKGRETYDNEYFAEFFEKVQPIIETRLSDSIVDSASLIAAAWVEAGRPPLPLKSSRPARRVRKQ